MTKQTITTHIMHCDGRQLGRKTVDTACGRRTSKRHTIVIDNSKPTCQKCLEEARRANIRFRGCRKDSILEKYELPYRVL